MSFTFHYSPIFLDVFLVLVQNHHLLALVKFGPLYTCFVLVFFFFLCFVNPTHSPIPHSLTSVQPACSPHDIPLLILSCIFHSHVHAILTASFLSLHRVMHPFVFLQRPQPLFCTPSQPMLVPPCNPCFHPHFHTHATNLSYPLITH